MKKLAIALMAMSMFALPSMNANAQAAGTIAGVPLAAAGIIAAVIVGVAVASNDSNGVPPAPNTPNTPSTPSTTSTTSTTSTSSTSSTSGT